jgi:predicted DNA-binding transcriptional regulator AlpA
MPENLSARIDAFRRGKGLDSDLADLIERIRRLEGGRPPPEDDPLINQEQAAVVIGVKPPTLAMWRHKDKGPPYRKIGRSAFYRRSDIEQWLDAQCVIPGLAGTDAG